MQAIGNQRFFNLAQLMTQTFDGLFRARLPVLVSQFTGRRLLFDQTDQLRQGFPVLLLLSLAPTVDGIAQTFQALIQLGAGHRRRQVTDQGSRRTSLGDQPFRGIV